MRKMGKLNLDVEVGDTLHIGEAKVRLEEKSGRLARLSIVADSKIKINLLRKSASDKRGINSWLMYYSCASK